MGGSGEEMRFSLPAAPSPATQEALLAAAREVARAGGHFLSPAALALLCWELGDAVLASFRFGATQICFVLSVTSLCWRHLKS